MPKDSPEDVSMTRVRAWVEQHKPTLHELGLRMGFDEGTARQSAYQFLKGKDPRIRTLRRFANAAGLTVEELVSDSGESEQFEDD
jgi:transcriptional regulator with XRE-family HTH domain